MDKNLTRVFREIERRHAHQNAAKLKADAIFESLFTEQREVASSKSRKVAVLTSRRAGKSWTICTLMVIQCILFPKSRCLYLALTRENIKRIAWELLQEINIIHNLGITFNKVSLIAVFPNGSSIECGGAKGTKEEAERYLGAKFNMVAIDEAGSFSFPLLEYLINTILMPTLLDARPEGKLFLTGTPRMVMKGVFYDATTKDMPGWDKFHWTTDSNVHLSTQYLEEMQELMATNPDIESDPIFIREYLGRWAIENRELVYRLNHNINVINNLPIESPTNKFLYIVGVDIGWNDDCAFVLGCYRKHDPIFYIIDCFKKPQMLPDSIASQLDSYIKDYSPIYIVMDTGGSGAKTIAQEMSYRYNIPVQAALKTEKKVWVGLLNSDLISGRVKILERTCGPLITEMEDLTWKEKPNGDFEENPALPNHLCDAMLYGFRDAFHYKEKPLPDEIKIGSEEYWEAEDKRMFEESMNRVKNKSRGRRKF